MMRFALVATLALVAGCASTPAERAQADMKKLRAEHSGDKLFDRGRAFAQVGDLTRAEEYLVAAIDEGKDPAVVLPVLFDVCVRGGKYRVAVQYAEQHLAHHPSDVSTRFVLGTLYAALGEGPEAREALEAVLRARPREARAHYALAVLLRDVEGDPAGADQHFRRYLAIDPKGAHADEARESLLRKMPSRTSGDRGAAAIDGDAGATDGATVLPRRIDTDSSPKSDAGAPGETP